MSGENTETRTVEPEQDERRQAPFATKNLAALKIGSRSPRVYGVVAEGIAGDLLHDAPHLAAYPEDLAALAQTEAVVALIRIELAARGISKNGEPRLALLDRYFRAEAAAAKRRDAMGLSPLGEATLAERRASAAAIAQTVDLDALAARGRAALDARAGSSQTQPAPDLVLTVLEKERGRYAAEREATTAAWKASRTPTDDKGDTDGNEDH